MKTEISPLFLRLPLLPCLLLAVLFWPAVLARAAGGAPAAFDVRDYGAAGDGKTLDTAALNTTIDAVAAAGGRVVRVPPGTYLTGTIRLRSNLRPACASSSAPGSAPRARWTT